MKKKLAYFFIVIVLLLAVVYFFRYKQGLQYEDKVPASAEAVLHLNLRQIEQDVVFDAIANPFSYIDISSSKKDDDKKDKTSLLDGISIPKNVFLFTNSSHFNGFFISNKLKIKDKTDFEKFLTQENFTKQTRGEVTILKKGKLFVAMRNDDFIVAFNYKNIQSSLSFFTDIFNNDSFLDENATLLNSIKKSTSDGVFVTKNNDYVELALNDGEFTINGKLNDSFNWFLPTQTKQYNDSVVAFTSGKLNIKTLQQLTTKQKNKFSKLTSLSLDSIAQKWLGDFSLNIASIEHKTDTIVTYEYDDDFNKVEKKSTQKLVNPNLDFAISGTRLYDYFVGQNAIQLVESDSLFTTIPLFKLYANRSNKTITISSDKEIKLQNSEVDDLKFSLFLNIEKYLKNQLDFYTIKEDEHIDLLQKMTASISKDNQLSVKIEFKNKSRNVAGQLIKP